MGILEAFKNKAKGLFSNPQKELESEVGDIWQVYNQIAGGTNVVQTKDSVTVQNLIKDENGYDTALIRVTTFKDPNKAPEYTFCMFDYQMHADGSSNLKVKDFYKVQCAGDFNNPKALASFKMQYLKGAKFDYDYTNGIQHSEGGTLCTATVRTNGQSTEFLPMNSSDLEVADKKANPAQFFPSTEDITYILQAFKDMNLLGIANENSARIQDDSTPSM